MVSRNFERPLACGTRIGCFHIGFRGWEYDFGHPEAILSGITMVVFSIFRRGVKFRPVAMDYGQFFCIFSPLGQSMFEIMGA